MKQITYIFCTMNHNEYTRRLVHKLYIYVKMLRVRYEKKGTWKMCRLLCRECVTDERKGSNWTSTDFFLQNKKIWDISMFASVTELFCLKSIRQRPNSEYFNSNKSSINFYQVLVTFVSFWEFAQTHHIVLLDKLFSIKRIFSLFTFLSFLMVLFHV